eukprot:774122-Pleurochrysis_carterae.AAC.1
MFHGGERKILSTVVCCAFESFITMPENKYTKNTTAPILVIYTHLLQKIDISVQVGSCRWFYVFEVKQWCQWSA